MSETTTSAWTRRIFEPSAPALRLALVRVVVVAYALVALVVIGTELPRLLDQPASRFAAVGAMTLHGPPTAAAAWSVYGVTLLAGLGALVGWRYRYCAPSFALGLLWVASLRHSWGHVGHGEHLLVLHVLVLAASPAADTCRLDGRRVDAGDTARYGWPLRVMAVVTVLTYVLAGWAKLRFGAEAWLGGDAVRLQVAFDAARKARLGVDVPWLAAKLVPHAWAFVPLSWLTLAVELGAPLALLGPAAARRWSLAAWTMHVGIALVMGIAFAYPLTGVAFLALLRPERGLARLSRRRRRRRRRHPLVSGTRSSYRGGT